MKSASRPSRPRPTGRMRSTKGYDPCWRSSPRSPRSSRKPIAGRHHGFSNVRTIEGRSTGDEQGLSVWCRHRPDGRVDVWRRGAVPPLRGLRSKLGTVTRRHRPRPGPTFLDKHHLETRPTVRRAGAQPVFRRLLHEAHTRCRRHHEGEPALLRWIRAWTRSASRSREDCRAQSGLAYAVRSGRDDGGQRVSGAREINETPEN